MKTSDLKSFNYLENGEILFSPYDTVKSRKTLDSGFYSIGYIGYPENRVKLKNGREKEGTTVHYFPDKQKIDDLFKSFFDNRVASKIEDIGFYHKIGVLLYGKEGTGKSTIIKHYCQRAINENEAIVFEVDCHADYIQEVWDFILGVRRIQDSPIIVVFEEIDSLIDSRSEGKIKSILDGNMSIGNCVFLASTNYIDNIPSALKDRPSRFKYTFNIEGIQSKDDVSSMLKNMIGNIATAEEIDSYSDSLIGKTLDEIKQFSIDRIMGIKTFENKKRKAAGFK